MILIFRWQSWMELLDIFSTNSRTYRSLSKLGQFLRNICIYVSTSIQMQFLVLFHLYARRCFQDIPWKSSSANSLSSIFSVAGLIVSILQLVVISLLLGLHWQPRIDQAIILGGKRDGLKKRGSTSKFFNFLDFSGSTGFCLPSSKFLA